MDHLITFTAAFLSYLFGSEAGTNNGKGDGKFLSCLFGSEG
ncbi:hypothetical protein HMPREF9996_02275, partial [Aggregatibacter actinomycetemcomitans Y4]